MTYKVIGRVYRVLEGENAYEYEVSLYDGEEEIDTWNSLFECYSIHHPHLTHDGAVRAVREITEDVHNGKADDWFDLQ
ncbi:hypothetical protein [Halapricum desulfuricans]|uniref:Uncharacterized protein n=1 Tax=Halapricum desulfuricans TaxID=2841257 RepID=A0A897N2C0_9EURY|nr:hypothetical protein [Halapricum desulfuricans]QSG06368.1 hypothetical protein HSR121_2036 [Halapricum desulfuricans]